MTSLLVHFCSAPMAQDPIALDKQCLSPRPPSVDSERVLRTVKPIPAALTWCFFFEPSLFSRVRKLDEHDAGASEVPWLQCLEAYSYLNSTSTGMEGNRGVGPPPSPPRILENYRVAYIRLPSVHIRLIMSLFG